MSGAPAWTVTVLGFGEPRGVWPRLAQRRGCGSLVQSL